MAQGLKTHREVNRLYSKFVVPVTLAWAIGSLMTSAPFMCTSFLSLDLTLAWT